MQEQLTMTIEEDVYEGLRAVTGARKITCFIEAWVRLHGIKRNMYAAYEETAADHVR